MSIRQDLYNYRKNQKALKTLQDRILFLRTKAAKVTPTYSNDGSSHSGSSEDRILDNIVKIVDVEKKLQITAERVKRADDFLSGLKPYQKYIITQCIVNHTPYADFARTNKTTPANVKRIIENTLK